MDFCANSGSSHLRFLNAEMECKNVRFGKKNSELSVETVGYCLWGSKIPLLMLKNSGGMSLDQIYKNSPTLKEKIYGEIHFSTFSANV